MLACFTVVRTSRLPGKLQTKPLHQIYYTCTSLNHLTIQITAIRIAHTPVQQQTLIWLLA